MQAAGSARAGKRDDRWFATTHWSAVAAAGKGDGAAARSALETLCSEYWYPLYAFVRRLGHSHADAEDLTQGFFTRLLERDFLRAADRSRGRFRSFLLTCLKHHLAHVSERLRTEKRGGRNTFISLACEQAEERFGRDPVSHEIPETYYDLQWACLVMGRSLQRLRREFAETDRLREFEGLKRFLSVEASPGDYEAAAKRNGLTANAVAVTVHRLRHRYGAIVRQELLRTVAEPADVDDELRHLIGLDPCTTSRARSA